MSFFSDKMVPAAYRLQAYKQISELKMPVYVFMGENDYLYPESKEFVKKLKAPHKKFIAYPNVGHEVEYFKGEEIMKILIDIKL